MIRKMRILQILEALVIAIALMPPGAGADEGPKEPPDKLVDKEGKFNYGWYRRPIEQINLEDLKGEEGFGGSLFKSFRKKIWHRYIIQSPEIVMEMVIRDFGYMGGFSLFLLVRKSGELYEYRFNSPLARGVSMSKNSMEGASRFGNREATVFFGNDYSGRIRYANIMIKGSDEKPSLLCNSEIREDPAKSLPLVIVTELPDKRGFYTHRNARLPVKGRVVVGSKKFILEEGSSWAYLEWTAGYFPSDSEWESAVAMGRSASGQGVAVDLFRYGNDSRSSAAGAFFWVKGMLRRVRGPRFEHDGPEEGWKIFTAEREIDLSFEPKKSRRAELRFLNLSYACSERWGAFQGSISGIELGGVGEMFGTAMVCKARW